MDPTWPPWWPRWKNVTIFDLEDCSGIVLGGVRLTGKIVRVSLSRSQLDRLGQRLRVEEITAKDLRSLDEYRRSFLEPYANTAEIIRNELKLEPTGRPAKSTTSIRDKLRRESIRLSQIQDIAGCRIIVPDIIIQDETVRALVDKLGDVKIFDRRAKPSHGYRAVHLIAQCADRPIEIQVRSAFQHIWAELSEKIADMFDPALKYGNGPEQWSAWLSRISNSVAEGERLQMKLHNLKIKAGDVSHVTEVSDLLRQLEREVVEATTHYQNALRLIIAEMSE